MQNHVGTISFMFCFIFIIFFHVLVFIVTLRSENETFWDFVFSKNVICEHCSFDIMWLLYSQLKLINILRSLISLYYKSQTVQQQCLVPLWMATALTNEIPWSATYWQIRTLCGRGEIVTAGAAAVRECRKIDVVCCRSWTGLGCWEKGRLLQKNTESVSIFWD